MSFPLVKPPGFGLSDPLASAEVELLQQYLALATDTRRNPDALPALNIQRYEDPFGAANIHDLVWDPVAKRFVVIAEVSGEARATSTPDFRGLPTYVVIGNNYFGGSDYSADRIVVVQDNLGSGLISYGDTVGGFTLASTSPGVQCGRPIYAWDIDTWVVAGPGGTAYLSVDGGANWAGALTPPTTTSASKRLTPATDGSRILMGAVAASTTAFAWSDDGDDWTDGTLPNPVEEAQCAYDPIGEKWVIAGKTPSASSFRVFISNDNAETFTLVATHSGAILGADIDALGDARVMGIGFVSGLLLVALNTGRVLASNDYGATFTDVGHNMEIGTGYVAEKCRILSNPFGPNMYLSYGSVGTGGPPGYLQDLFASLRTGL